MYILKVLEEVIINVPNAREWVLSKVLSWSFLRLFKEKDDIEDQELLSTDGAELASEWCLEPRQLRHNHPRQIKQLLPKNYEK